MSHTVSQPVSFISEKCIFVLEEKMYGKVIRWKKVTFSNPFEEGFFLKLECA